MDTLQRIVYSSAPVGLHEMEIQQSLEPKILQITRGYINSRMGELREAANLLQSAATAQEMGVEVSLSAPST
jgi:hypothetical protein